MATQPNAAGPDGRGFTPDPSLPPAKGLEGAGNGYARRLPPGQGPYTDQGQDLRALLGQLGQDVSQLAHDEMTLAKLELRSVADTLTNELQAATKTMVKDLAKVGIALSLAVLAGLALTAGAIMGIGALLDAYWAGGLIVGVIYLIAAAMFGMSAGKDLKTSDALRLDATRRRAEQNKDVLAREARETKRFAKEEAKDFKDHASAKHTNPATRH